MTVVAAVALPVLVLANWAAVWRAATRAEAVTKPLALLALIALAVALGAPDTDFGVSVLVALGLRALDIDDRRASPGSRNSLV